MVIIDAQVHAYERNTRAAPGRCPNGPAESRAMTWWRPGRRRGGGAVLVSPFTMYGYDAAMRSRFTGSILGDSA